MLGSPFSSRTGNVIDPHSNPGQFAGRAILTESRRAGRMARRSWIYIVCLGENWFFMRDTWGYLAIYTLEDLLHVRAAAVRARAGTYGYPAFGGAPNEIVTYEFVIKRKKL